MSYRYKCNRTVFEGRCNTRVSLKHLIGWYKRKPKCPNCGAKLTYRDHAREKESRDNKCTCDGYHFPHAKGSKYCNENRHNLTDADFEARYNSIPTNF